MNEAMNVLASLGVGHKTTQGSGTSRWSFVNLDLFEGRRSEPLQRACCCLNFCRCVSKTRTTVITQSGSNAWIWSTRDETVNLGGSLVFSARNSTLGCRHIKCLRYWVCQHSSHLRDGLTSTLVSQHVLLSSTCALAPTMILTDEAAPI